MGTCFLYGIYAPHRIRLRLGLVSRRFRVSEIRPEGTDIRWPATPVCASRGIDASTRTSFRPSITSYLDCTVDNRACPFSPPTGRALMAGRMWTSGAGVTGPHPTTERTPPGPTRTCSHPIAPSLLPVSSGPACDIRPHRVRRIPNSDPAEAPSDPRFRPGRSRMWPPASRESNRRLTGGLT